MKGIWLVCAYLDGLSCLLLDPLSCDLVVLVEAEESGLSSSLDQLIGLGDKLLSEHPLGETLSRLDGGEQGVGGRVPEHGRNKKRSVSAQDRWSQAEGDVWQMVDVERASEGGPSSFDGGGEMARATFRLVGARYTQPYQSHPTVNGERAQSYHSSSDMFPAE